MKRFLPLALIAFALSIINQSFADLTWSLRNEDAVNASVLWGIAKGPAGVVTCGTNGAILQSTDGVTWQPRAAGVSSWLLSATYGDGHYIVVGDQGTILSSVDGQNWVRVGVGVTSQRLNRVLFAHNKFVAVGEAETILYSTDGLIWEVENTGGVAWLRGLSATEPRPDYLTDETWIATGQGGIVYTSINGQNWTLQTPLDSEQLTPYSGGDLESVGFLYPFSTVSFLSGKAFLGVGMNSGVEIDELVSDHNPFLVPAARTATLGTAAPFQLRGLAISETTSAKNDPLSYIAVGDNSLIYDNQTSAFSHPVAFQGRSLKDAVFYNNSYLVVGDERSVYQSAPLYTTKLANISSRAYVAGGERVIIAGAIITGSAPKKILIRGIGPTLADYQVAGFLSDPQIQVYDQTGKQIAQVGAWSKSSGIQEVRDALTQLGSTLDSSRSDSALVLTLPPGGYTFIVSSLSGKSGVALVDAFDLDDAASSASKFINLSTRAFVGPGEQTLIAGLIINGGGPKRVLFRGIGPKLAGAGIAAPLDDPVLTVFDQSGNAIATNDDWGTPTTPDTVFNHTTTKQEISTLMKTIGLTSLDDSSVESVIVMKLLPGAYTVQITGKNARSGVALVEAYELTY